MNEIIHTVSKRQVKIIVEQHPDVYIAYPLGITGACVSQGYSYDEALAEVKVMLNGLIELYGDELFEDDDSPVMAAFVEEATVGV